MLKGICGKRDTVVVEKRIIVPAETVFVNKVNGKVVYRPLVRRDTVKDTVVTVDTVLSTKPFTSYMDTTIGCNHIKMEYNYPEHTFTNIQFVTCPDTIITHDTVVTTTEPALNDKLRYAGYGVIGGFVLGILSR